MDYYVNSKSEEETIYEIYKACRLCGAGAGYKMPIIQNVVNISTDEIELKQKIRECVQIEVHQDDKMPPLICELCVDKVNDFYEFMDMCKQTNKKTRLRLGLPPQTLPCGAPDAGDCILGVTEPVYINENSNEAILTRRSKIAKNVKTKKEPEAVKVESKTRRKDDLKPSNVLNTSTRSSRSKEASSPRSRRGTKRLSDDDVSLSRFQKTRRPDAQGLKSILKKNITEDEPRHKRTRDSISRETIKSEANKKVKISLNVDKKSSKPEAKSSKTYPTRSPPLSHNCHKCKMSFKTSQALANHMRIHPSPKVHKRIASPPPSRYESKPKTRWCSKCQKTVLTNIFKTHKCSKRTWDCSNCKRKFLTPQALASHAKYCKASAEVRVPRKWMSMVRPLQVRIRRCDSLLEDKNCCDASAVSHDFGLDKDCTYPYLNMSVRKLRIKSELAAYDSMVNIQDEIRDEFDLDECYVHWDSESEVDSDMDISASDTHLKTHNVKKLSSLSLKVIYSPKMLGKVPKKLRKSEKPFESIQNVSDMSRGIDNIIDSLEDKSDNISKTIEDDFLFNDNKRPGVKNSEFDSIFHSEISDENCKSSTSITTTEKIDVNIKNKDESCNNGANSETSGDKILDHDSILSGESVNINEYDSTSSKIDIEHKIIECNKSSETNNSDKSENSEDKITNSIADTEIKDTKTNENNEPEEESITRECREGRIVNKLNVETDINEKQSPVNEVIADKPKEASENAVETDLIEDYNNMKADEKDEEQVIDSKNNDSEIIDNCKNTDNESVNHKLQDDNGQESVETRICENKEDIKDENNKTLEALTSFKEDNDIKADVKDEKQIIDYKNNGSEITDNCKNTDNESVNHKLECDDGQESVQTRLGENKEDIKDDNNKTFEACKVNGDLEATDKFNMDDLEDLSDTDMDDKKLMEALDAQIGENDTKSIDANSETNK